MGQRNNVMGGGSACEYSHRAFDTAPHKGTKRCAGLGGRMRTPQLVPSVDLPMRPRAAALGGGDAGGQWHLGLGWSSRSTGGHETLYWMGVTHAGGATAAFGGAPCGATKRCTGWVVTHAGGARCHWGV
eukprot:9473075-Pyramimonas_sp.AAC.1